MRLLVFEVAAFILSFLVVFIILSPFWLSKPEALQSAMALNSDEQIEDFKEKILYKLHHDENLVKQNILSKREWETRKNFLHNRYVDAVRRQDFMNKNISFEKE